MERILEWVTNVLGAVNEVVVGLVLALMVVMVMAVVYCVQWQSQFHQHWLQKQKQR